VATSTHLPISVLFVVVVVVGTYWKKKGKTGDWKNHFSPELNERIDKWMEAHLAGTDLRFVTELEEQD